METLNHLQAEKIASLLQRILKNQHTCKFTITQEEMFQLQELNKTIQEAKQATRKRLVDVICGALGVVILYGLIEWIRSL
jgi:predicted Holliday junction resolvase-like endonuclease